jgi:hypothetical protein
MNVSELAFVLEGPDPDLLNRLTVGEQRYDAVRTIIAARNDAHAALQRRAAALQVQDVAAMERAAFEVALGKDLVTQVKDLTTGLFENHESALALLKQSLEGIETFASVMFPEKRRPKVEVIPIEQRR